MELGMHNLGHPYIALHWGMICIMGTMGCTSVIKKSISATGCIIGTSVKAAGGVVIDTVGDLASKTAKKGTVTVVDTILGTRQKVPWGKGITAYAASQNAKIELAKKTLKIIRNAQRIKADEKTLLKSGDVIEIKTIPKP